ncbi:MAG: SDR family oxidoreductase [Bacteroidota bacterium]
MDQKRAMISGAASGLGLEFCRLLAADRYDLILVDKHASGLDKASKELHETYGIQTDAHCIDLSVQGAGQELFEAVQNQEIDILINNAGFGVYGFFAETPWEVEEAMLQLHVLALTHLSKLMVQKMIRRGSGRILNVSSLAALQPGPLMNIYYASKAYIYSFSRALANELKGTGVSVSVLLPGLFNTSFASTTARNSGAPVKREKHRTTSVEQVAVMALKGMMKGKSRIIPGWKNRAMARASQLLPVSLVMAVLRLTQERIRK